MKYLILFLLFFYNAEAGLRFLSPLKSSAFTPRSVAGLRLWLTTSATSSMNSGSFSDGDPLSTWTDQSANAYSITGSGGLRPTIETNELNGKPIIRSAASLLTGSIGTDMTSFTVFFVTKPTTFRQFDAIVTANNTFATGTITIELGSVSQFDVWDTNVGARMPTGLGTVSVNNWYIGCVTYTQSTPAGVFYINNTSLGTTNQASMFLESSIAFFDDNTSGFTAYRGDTASFVIYDNVLSSQDRTDVFNYLKTEFAL